MKSFTYHQPTKIIFGTESIKDIGGIVSKLGKRCLLVTVSPDTAPVFPDLFNFVKASLKKEGIAVEHYYGVIPNPTTEIISAGAEVAISFAADVVVGIGGGSSMDTAKAIAVEATHPGTAWDYRWCNETQPTEKTLPIVAIPTTSGTGSEVTQVAVLTHPGRKDKSAIFNSIIYPKVAIVDPELSISVPPSVTAQTGFDVFTHAFESYLHPNASLYTDLLGLEAIRLVAENLPEAINNGENMSAREGMAWASTLAGLCIANAGVTLPHGIGMTISGYCPHIPHGKALAAVYPEFTRFTYPYAKEKFAEMGRIFDPSLEDESDEIASKKSCEVLDDFMKEINMWFSLEDLGATKEDIKLIADHSQVLPDYKNNPRVATRDEIYEILIKSYERDVD